MSEIIKVEEGVDKLQTWINRAEKFEGKIQSFIENGIGWTPEDDQIVYCQSVIPNLSDEDLKGTDPLVLETMFEGDTEGDISKRKLTLISMGPKCTKTHLKPGQEITVRGHAYKIDVKGETFFSVREYDLIGSFDA
tara:strand:+ start:303 stop:710 length:408 start_codon:yes stop_codon:yes gene_type:complete